jgi:hypothetical protein
MRVSAVCVCAACVHVCVHVHVVLPQSSERHHPVCAVSPSTTNPHARTDPPPSSSSFPLGRYKSLKIDPFSQEALTAEQVADLNSNVQLCRDAIVFFTACGSVRCAFSDRNAHSWSAIEFHAVAPLQASRRVTNGDSSRVATFLTGWYCNLRPNTAGLGLWWAHRRCVRHGARGTVLLFFDRSLHSRSANEFHAFAPLEALPCV